MNNNCYIEPSVRLISGNDNKLGFYAWLKSREDIVTSLAGTKFMKDFTYAESWFSYIPNEFKVGNETVSKFDYINKIDKMNLQYNNLEYYVFSIDGSCLFRDLLYNINTISQWATSNRFKFSTYGPDAIYDRSNYKISSEYKGIVEWENQFDRYMDKRKETQITDENRIEMPYSISSRFFIGINKKTLINLLIMLKKRFPFFYSIYGTRMINASVGLGDIDYDTKVDSSLEQYFIHKPDDNESVTEIDDYFHVHMNMGLILYSQFIRQSSTVTSGLFNLLAHSDPYEFSKKVFKGGTVFNIRYMASRDKTYSTVSTRLCAFAMSSGNGPCSWSHFIDLILKNDGGMNLDKFKSLLPCTWDKNGKLLSCKFHEDIKFRQEGVEINNCPCPILANSIELAQSKKDRDKNYIGDSYYEIVKHLNN